MTIDGGREALLLVGCGALATLALGLRLRRRSRLNHSPHRLKRRFEDAGRLSGRSRADIISAVGRPDVVTPAPFGGVLLRWARTLDGSYYEIVLMFDAEGRCVGISHEHEIALPKKPH